MLKLVEAGQLDLNAPIKALVPEIVFSNPWAATVPVRLVHLLEHTTGWDIAFWRPLAAATHVADQFLWPGKLTPIHLHSLLWLAALLIALHHLLRRFLSPGIANLVP